MNTFMRRDFLKKILFASLLTGGSSSKSYALSKLNNKRPASSPEIDAKMREAYKSWTHKFGQKPEKFLTSFKQKPAANKTMSYLNKKEFKAGDTINFNEVLLGKTEAAVILNAYFS